ncbi:hypothetical protein WDU94_009251 [Cyamophila willieti]
MRSSKSASISSHNSRHSSACCERRTGNKTPSEQQKENIVPLSNVFSNSMIAKSLAKENLLHQPLPDNFDENMFKISNEKLNPHECNTTAVGCKCYGVPGPTQCSKLKVYRPKTAPEKHSGEARSHSSDRCHRDAVKADKKEFYSDIDYALCWDLCPPGPGHPETKKTAHIDGSNGSLAPAVFSLVPSRDPSPCLYETKRDGLHSPQPPRVLSAKCCTKTSNHDTKRVAKAKEWVETTTPVNPSAVMTIVKKPEPQENYFSFKQEQTEQQQRPRCGSCTSNRCDGKHKREPSPKLWNSEEFVGLKEADHKRFSNKEEVIEQRLKQRNIHSSSPNLAVHRPEHTNQVIHPKNLTNNNMNYNHDNQHGSANGHHKNGIKVSKDYVCPKLQRSRDSSISSNSRKTVFSPPKLKNHHVKKSYSIPTLLPPFTLWPGTTGQDYPEHWRLASVYQHSYKPIEMRKKNLMQCIYQ